MSMAFQVRMKRDEHQRAHEIRECVCQVADRDVCVEIKWVCSVCFATKQSIIYGGETGNA